MADLQHFPAIFYENKPPGCRYRRYYQLHNPYQPPGMCIIYYQRSINDYAML